MSEETEEVIKKPKAEKPKAAELPTKIILTCPFAFYDEDERLHSWQAGQVVEDQAEIAVLVAAGAEHTIAE
ncbi:MAG: hypothetical protein ACXWAT_00865 [Methylobacter sp.]